MSINFKVCRLFGVTKERVSLYLRHIQENYKWGIIFDKLLEKKIYIYNFKLFLYSLLLTLKEKYMMECK